MIPGNKKLKFSILFIALFLIICFTWLIISIPWILDSASVKHEVSDFLSKQLNTPVTTQNIDLKLFPRPCLRVKGLKIEIKGIKLFIKTTLFYPNILSLTKGKIDISRIFLKEVLTSLPTPETSGSGITQWPQLILPPKLNLFSLLPKNQKNLSIIVENFHSDLFERADASFAISVKERKAKGEVSVKNLKIKDHALGGMEKNIQSISALSLTTRFSYGEPDNLDINLELTLPKIVPNNPQAQKISGKKITATALLRDDRIEVHMDPVLLDSPELTCAIDFGFDPRTEKTSLSFKGKDINIDKTRAAALELLKESNICCEIFSILQGGVAPFVTVSFESDNFKKIFDPKKMIITGNINSGVVKIPKTELMVSKIEGKVTMAKGVLHTDVTKGSAEGAMVSKGSLDVDILAKHNPFEGKFDLTSNLSMLPGALKKLLPGTLLSRELGRCDRIQGKAMGTLGLKKGEKDLEVSVKAKEIDLSGRYNRIPGNIHIIAKEFSYDHAFIAVTGMNATSHLGTLSNVTGSITLGSDPFIRIGGDTGLMDLSKFFPWLTSFDAVKTSLPPMASASGKIKIDQIAMEGPVLSPKKWNYAAQGSLAQGTLENKFLESEISNASLSFNISEEKSLFTDIYATVNKTSLVSAVTKIPKLNELAVPIKISKGFLSTKDPTTQAFRGNLTFNTGTELSIDIEGNIDAYTVNLAELREKNRTQAQVLTREGYLNFQGSLDTRTLETLLKKESPTLKKLIALTHGKGFQIESNRDKRVTVTTDFIDLDEIKNQDALKTADAKTKKPTLFKPDLFKTFTLKANTLKYKGYLFSPVEALITKNHKKTEISIIKAQQCAMDIKGSIITDEDAIDIQATIESPDGDLDKTLSCIYGKNNLIKGAYSLKVDLRSSGGKINLAKNINGVINLTSPGGRIYKLTLLSRILSVINIAKFFKGKLPDIEQNGFAYNSLDLDAEIDKSRIVIKSAVIDAVDMTLIFTGWIDPAKNTMDLICLIAPFKSADLLIEKIPILGRILNGRLISIPVKAKGSINDPEVFLLPPKEVGKGVVGTMQRILEAPFNLIDKLPSN